MKKKYLVFAASILAAVCLHAQNAVPSSCVAADSITKKYRTDAARLSVRNTYQNNTTYKDSIWIEAGLRNFYQRALLSVYNATSIPARDTVVSLFNIHTNLNPELNAMHIMAPPAQTWMLELKANQSPTSNPTVNNLMNKYSLQFTYYQNNINDKVIFTSDSNLNMAPLVLAFQNAQGVASASLEPGFNDVKNIVDTIGTGFVKLSYSLGWGSCADGCDLRRYWHFKVFSDCSVEYLGATGASLFLGMNPVNQDNNTLTLYPNPVQEGLNLKTEDQTLPLMISITDVTGKIVMKAEITQLQQQLNIAGLEPGLYFLNAEGNNKNWTGRFVKL